MKQLSYIPCFLLLALLFLSIPCEGQDYPYWENGRIYTFEIPKPPNPRPSDLEAWRNLEEYERDYALEDYEEKALKLIRDFSEGLKALSDPLQQSDRPYIVEYLKFLFLDKETAAPRRNPIYQGLRFDESKNEIVASTNLTLEKYLDYLASMINNDQKVNICWGVPEDLEAIQFKKIATHRLRSASEFTLTQDSVSRSYSAYKASTCIKEYAAFTTGGYPRQEEVCKNIEFELRCFERKNYDPAELESIEDAYYWTVTLSSIKMNRSGKKCCKELEVSCDEEGLEVPRDSTAQLTFQFDFGPGTAQLGYTKVDAYDTYSELNGYGIEDNSGVQAISSCQLSTSNCDDLLNEDYLLFSEINSFKVDLPNGSYFVRYHFDAGLNGDENKAYKMLINGRFFNVKPRPGKKMTTLKVEVTDKEMLIGFRTLGGTNQRNRFPINALVITPNANNFDFGPGITQDTFIQILADTKYSKKQGFGIIDLSKVRKSFETCDSPDADPIYCDHITFEKGGAFRIDRPNGPYSISFLSKSPVALKELRIENKKRKPRKNKSNQQEQIFDIVIEDRSIDLLFNDDATPVNGIIIRSGNCSKIVPGWTYAFPGLGFNAIRKRKGKKLFVWPLITAASYGAIGTGLYYKSKSIKNHNIHKKADTHDVSNAYYDIANKEHHKFLAYFTTGVLIWGISDLVILIKDKKQYKTCTKNWGTQAPAANDSNNTTSLRLSPYMDFMSNDSSVGVNLNFQF